MKSEMRYIAEMATVKGLLRESGFDLGAVKENVRVSRGANGAVEFDLVAFAEDNSPVACFEFKERPGGASLEAARRRIQIMEMVFPFATGYFVCGKGDGAKIAKWSRSDKVFAEEVALSNSEAVRNMFAGFAVDARMAMDARKKERDEKVSKSGRLFGIAAGVVALILAGVAGWLELRNVMFSYKVYGLIGLAYISFAVGCGCNIWLKIGENELKIENGGGK